MAQTLSRPRRRNRTRYRAIPPWPRGPKPRRRTELGLLVFGAIITASLYTIASLGRYSKIPPHLGPILGVVLALSLVAHLANRWLAPQANAVVLPIATLLNGIGYVIIVRWQTPGEPNYARLQAEWAAVGIFCYVLILLVVRHTRDLDRYRYLLLLAAGVLMVSPYFPGIGEEVNGARLFVRFPGLGHSAGFQPIEIAKLLLCIFFASYFAEKKELLSIPTARLGNRLVLDPRPLLPMLLAWGMAMAIIGLENDIGFAMLIFTLFIGLLWVSTGRVGYLVFGLALFAVGAFGASHIFGQFHSRVEVWLDPWSNPNLLGAQQLSGAWYAFANGGVGGTGLGRDLVVARGIPELTTDMIFSAIGDELGLIGTSAVVIAFTLLVGSGLRIAQTARSDFSRLVATGLTIIIGFQAFFIMAGVLRILPLTGITLPFIAYGGSSLVANYVLIALLLRVSDEGVRNPTDSPGETSFVVARN